VLAQFGEEAAGDDDRYPGASDDELLGVICGWDRVEAIASAQKHAAVVELLRRRPAPGSAVDERSGIPEQWGEFAGREVGAALALSSGEAEEAVALATALETSLPGTRFGSSR
jgi:hypothetical protein